VPAGASASSVPAELCGYVVDCALKEHESYLAIGPGGRGVVLKRLDGDCLLGGVLHPSIRERLNRVRELAHGGVANLHGVGRDADTAYLIWEYIQGKTFDQYVADDVRSPRDLLLLARELILGVDSLHAQGIVHGAITAGNVIIAPDDTVRLTHVSPLLYSDPQADVESAIALLRQALQRRGEQDSPLAQLLAEAAREQVALRPLGAKVAALLEAQDAGQGPAEQADDRHLRRRILIAAGLVALLGLAIGYGVWRAVTGTY
jgi:serine/threonine protein kinase